MVHPAYDWDHGPSTLFGPVSRAGRNTLSHRSCGGRQSSVCGNTTSSGPTPCSVPTCSTHLHVCQEHALPQDALRQTMCNVVCPPPFGLTLAALTRTSVRSMLSHKTRYARQCGELCAHPLGFPLAALTCTSVRCMLSHRARCTSDHPFWVPTCSTHLHVCHEHALPQARGTRDNV